jgi:hypothetical protein
MIPVGEIWAGGGKKLTPLPDTLRTTVGWCSLGNERELAIVLADGEEGE